MSTQQRLAFRGFLAETPLPQVLRRIFLEGLKGTLTLVRGDETRHLFFEKGELRTATSSREGQRIGAFLKRRGWITDQDLSWALETVAKQGRARLGKILLERGLVSRQVLDAEMRRLVEEIVFSTFEWSDGEYRFLASSGVLDPDVALALSTAAVIVEGIRRLPESEVFRERLGDGRQVPVLSSDPMSRYQYLPLTPQEAYILSRIDGRLDLDSLLKIGGASRASSAKTLYALLSCGIVELRKEGAALQGASGIEALNVEVAAQKSERTPGHAELVKNTYRRIDWLSHYELLGVRPEAPVEEIQQAYFERSRLFHPDLRHREDLAHCEKELTTVFERLKTAHETLIDPQARAAYDLSLAAAPAPVGMGDAAADPQAQKQLAAQNYRRAKALIDEKDYYPAVEMLREAIRFVPNNAEYRYTLAQVELRNSMWVVRGLENLKEAARLEPRKSQYAREAAVALHERGRDDEAEPFARRAYDIDSTAENRQLLDEVLAVLPAAAAAPASSFRSAPAAAAAPRDDSAAAHPEPAAAAPPPNVPPSEDRPTLFSRLFKPRS